MPNQILQVDENMLETKLDRLVSEKVEQLLNAMLDAEADEITGACRRSYTLECKTNAARRALEGEPLARVARDAGCTPTSVYQWMRRYRSEGILGLMDRRNAPIAGRTDARGRRCRTWRSCAGRWRSCGWRTR